MTSAEPEKPLHEIIEGVEVGGLGADPRRLDGDLAGFLARLGEMHGRGDLGMGAARGDLDVAIHRAVGDLGVNVGALDALVGDGAVGVEGQLAVRRLGRDAGEIGRQIEVEMSGRAETRRRGESTAMHLALRAHRRQIEGDERPQLPGRTVDLQLRRERLIVAGAHGEPGEVLIAGRGGLRREARRVGPGHGEVDVQIGGERPRQRIVERVRDRDVRAAHGEIDVGGGDEPRALQDIGGEADRDLALEVAGTEMRQVNSELVALQLHARGDVEGGDRQRIGAGRQADRAVRDRDAVDLDDPGIRAARSLIGLLLEDVRQIERPV